MAITVDESLTRKAAGLARLELTDTEVRTFTGQLSQILGYVDQLAQVNVEGVEPLTHPLDLDAPLREDRIVPAPDVLKHAPDVVDGAFKVPPVL